MNALISQWQEKDTGALSFYHAFHPRHGDPFADQVDTTALWLTLEYLKGGPTKTQIREILEEVLDSRALDWDAGRFYRYPGSNEELSKDQLDFLIPLMREVGMWEMAELIVANYGDTKLPHRKDHLLGRSTWLGRLFECIDSIVDWFSDSESSQMNNIARLLWSSRNGHKNERAIKLFRKKLDPYRVIEIYTSRRPDTPADEYDKLPGVITYDSPPPLYIIAKPVVKKYL